MGHSGFLGQKLAASCLLQPISPFWAVMELCQPRQPVKPLQTARVFLVLLPFSEELNLVASLAYLSLALTVSPQLD